MWFSAHSKKCIRENVCEKQEKQERKSELVWEWQSTQRPDSSRSNQASTSSALSSWLKGVTRRSLSWSTQLLSYCQPGIRTTAKLWPHIPTRLPSSRRKMLALPRTTFFASLVHCLASQGSISTHYVTCVTWTERLLSYSLLASHAPYGNVGISDLKMLF